MIDESKLNKAEMLLLRFHRNLIARAKAKGRDFDDLLLQHDELSLDIAHYLADLPQLPEVEGDKS